MPKYWGKQIFSSGDSPEVGRKQKTEREKERKNERAKVGNNNGQLRIPTPPQLGWRMQSRLGQLIFTRVSELKNFPLSTIL